MDSAQLINRSEENLGQSANTYQTVDISAADWTPAKPFKGIHVGVAGNLVLKGVDGVNATFAVAAGCYPYGGMTVVRTSTTATGLIALF